MNSILVTGSSTGIGEATVKLLIAKGHFVFGSVRNQKDADRLREQNPERFHPLIFDVIDEKAIAKSYLEVARIVDEKKLQFTGIVNNAGIVVAGPLEYIPVSELRNQFEINVFGQVTVTQIFLPLLKKFKGRIVMVSSVSGKMSFPLLSPYCSSKFAQESLSNIIFSNSLFKFFSLLRFGVI